MPGTILQLQAARRLIPEPARATALAVARDPRAALRHVPGRLVPAPAQEPEDESRDGDEEQAEADGDAGLFAEVLAAAALVGGRIRGWRDDAEDGADEDLVVAGGEEEGDVCVIRAVFEVAGVDFEGHVASLVAQAFLLPGVAGVGVVGVFEADFVGAVGVEEGGVPCHYAG